MTPVNEPLLNGNEKKYLMECIDTEWIASEGPSCSNWKKSLRQRLVASMALISIDIEVKGNKKIKIIMAVHRSNL